MILNNYKVIEEYYKQNLVWGYINENNGEIKLYSPSITKIIEKSYNLNKPFVNIEILNTVIYFKNTFTQKINNKTSTVFREEINNQLNYILIDKQVYLNRKTNTWKLYKKTEHMGLLLDLSINNIDKYKYLITNIILEHKKNSKFNNISNSNIIKIVNNNKNLLTLCNLNNIFIKNASEYASELTEDLCNGFIELLQLIKSNHYGDEFITIYVLTNSNNMKSINILYNTLLSEKKIDCKYELIQINIDDINLNDLKQIYM